MYLLIDDQKELSCELIARTAKAGKKALQALHKEIECLCIDHDLGSLTTGYDIINWALENNYLPKRVQIVSANPVGCRAIAKALLAANYCSKDNVNFIKRKK